MELLLQCGVPVSAAQGVKHPGKGPGHGLAESVGGPQFDPQNHINKAKTGVMA